MLLENYNHLGYNNPYFIKKDGKLILKKFFHEIMGEFGGIRHIDTVAVLELLNKGYMFADRTAIAGVQYAPWLAHPDNNMAEWVYEKAPEHGNVDVSEEEVAHKLFEKICFEIKSQVGNRKTIGILLSGGMDSRIVAAALNSLAKENNDNKLDITGLTWGNDNSRDVVYAKEITTRMGWKWKHYRVTAKDLLQNIHETAVHGCEYSPIHLHAIPQIKEDSKAFDIILAGSYGDSVGRAEFSGWKTKNVPDILTNISNPGFLLNDSTFRSSINQIHLDITNYRNIFPTQKKSDQKELDFQIHYMRRMLNPCMKMLDNSHTKFYQVFTDPATFGYMWSISLKRRTDLIYGHINKNYLGNLIDIPWARTGLIFGHTKGTQDSFHKKHHSYESIIANELRSFLGDKILSSSLNKLNIFNPKSIRHIYSLVMKYPRGSINYQSKLLWLAALSEMVDIYNIQPSTDPISNKVKNNNLKISSEFFLNTIIKKRVVPFYKRILHKIS